MSGETEPGRFPVPSFLGIGAQKAGTTWLWQNLREHREVFLPLRKELHFLDQHWDRGWEWYHKHYRPRRVRARRPGEITPAYLVLPPERIESVHRENPETRLVLMIREPVERAWSAAKYFVRNQQQRPITDVAFSEFQAMVTRPLMLERGDYLEGIRLWTDVFGADSLLAVFHDDVLADPDQEFVRVLNHIGVDPDVDLDGFPLGEVFNRGPSSQIPDRHRAFLDELLGDQVTGLASLFPEVQHPWLRGRAD